MKALCTWLSVTSGAAKPGAPPSGSEPLAFPGPSALHSPTGNGTATGNFLNSGALVSTFKMFLRWAVNHKSMLGVRNTEGSQWKMHSAAASVHTTHGEKSAMREDMDAKKESLNKYFEDCNLSVRNSDGSPSLSLKAQFKLTVAKAGERWRHSCSAGSKPHPESSPPSPSQVWAFAPLLAPREIHFQCTPASRKCMLKPLLWAKVTYLKTTCTFEMLTYKQ